jgi:hypothetical protein
MPQDVALGVEKSAIFVDMAWIKAPEVWIGRRRGRLLEGGKPQSFRILAAHSRPAALQPWAS